MLGIGCGHAFKRLVLIIDVEVDHHCWVGGRDYGSCLLVLHRLGFWNLICPQLLLRCLGVRLNDPIGYSCPQILVLFDYFVDLFVGCLYFGVILDDFDEMPEIILRGSCFQSLVLDLRKSQSDNVNLAEEVLLVPFVDRPFIGEYHLDQLADLMMHYVG